MESRLRTHFKNHPRIKRLNDSFGLFTMSNAKSHTRKMMVALLAAGSMLNLGCTAPTMREEAKLVNVFKKPKWLKAPWSEPENEVPKPYPNPVKIASTWTPDVLVQTGKTPTRGIGGRLFFFDEKTKAVPVEGTLTVHGFEIDAQGNDKTVRPFKFTPEQFTQHFSESDFGASYSVWIPWDRAGSEQKRISLVPTFETVEGKLVQGSPTTMILPGRKDTPSGSMAVHNLSPRYRGHQDAVANHPTRPSGLVTTTIRRYGTTEEGQSTLPSPSLQERVNSYIASHQNGSPEQTRFADIPSSQPPSTPLAVPRSTGVMPASAVMNPAAGNQVRTANQTRPADNADSTPRRISSPIQR